MAVGAAAIGAIGSVVGSALGLVHGKKESSRAKAWKRNNDAAEINYNWNEKAAENAHQRQIEMYNKSLKDNSPLAVRQRMEEAGLNYGLMMSGGAQGGSGTIANAPQGGASGAATPKHEGNDVERRQAKMATIGMGLQLAMMKSQIRKTEAEAENAEAGAENQRANAKKAAGETMREAESRNLFVRNLKESTIAQWRENEIRNWQGMDHGDRKFDYTVEDAELGASQAFHNNSYIGEMAAADIAKAWGEANNVEAMKELNSAKARGYWTELLNATAHADADKMKAAAAKLSTEWNTGEYTNWKTWTEIATKVVGDVGKAVAVGKGAKALGKGTETTTTSTTRKWKGGSTTDTYTKSKRGK